MSMKKVVSIASHNSVFFVSVLALSSLALAQHTMQPAGQENQNKLVQIVRLATKQYLDINNAIAAGYGPFLGCVSGSDHGAMGIHYVNPSLLNGTINATQPQALIYEPSFNGQMTLVGVEYIAGHLAREQLRSSYFGGSGISLRRQPKPIPYSVLLRASRLGVAGQPARLVC
jgi:hypothetical protein